MILLQKFEMGEDKSVSTHPKTLYMVIISS